MSKLNLAAAAIVLTGVAVAAAPSWRNQKDKARLAESARAHLADAEAAAKRALKVDERTLPTYHPDLAKGLSNLATIYTYERKYKEAESLYERAVSIA